MNTSTRAEVKNQTPFATIIKFSGFIDVSVIDNMRAQVLGEIGQNFKNIIIDLTDTDFIDSHGIGFFVSLLKKTHERGGLLVFAGAEAQPLSILKMVGFNERLAIYCKDIKEAEKMIAKHKG